MSNSIALIELSNSHDECLYSQVLFLKKASYQVHLIIPEELVNRVQHYPVDSIVVLKPTDRHAAIIVPYLTKNKIKNIVFNTCSGNDIRSLIFRLPFGMNITGVIHNAEKLNSITSQSVISLRIKKYFVLNDYILNNLHTRKSIKVQSMYPIYFNTQQIKIPKPDSETWICIPGSLEAKRRDYIGLVDTLKPGDLKNVKFLILGRTKPESNDYIEFRQKLEEKGLLPFFVLFFDFLDLNTFHSYLEKSDFIMPLIHPSKKKYEAYKKYKVSGSFNLAFAYKKILLMENSWEQIDDFKNISVFYSLSSLSSMTATIKQLSDRIAATNPYQHITKFDFNFQASQYVAHISKR